MHTRMTFTLTSTSTKHQRRLGFQSPFPYMSLLYTFVEINNINV